MPASKPGENYEKSWQRRRQAKRRIEQAVGRAFAPNDPAWVAEALAALIALYNAGCTPAPETIRPPQRVAEQTPVGLTRLFELTGDPLYKWPLAAMRATGLDNGWEIARFAEKSDWRLALIAIHGLISNREITTIAAARKVAVKFAFDGTFRSVVDRLRLDYPDAAKHGFPKPAALGAIGKLFVVPLDGHTFLMNGRKIDDFPDHVRENALAKVPATGAEVVDNLYWRQAFDRGEVMVRRVVENL